MRTRRWVDRKISLLSAFQEEMSRVSVVEHLFLSLCSFRGFRDFTTVSALRRMPDRDILLECYRQLPNEPNGWHFPNVKMNIYDLLPGLEKSKPLKPNQYMIERNFDRDILLPGDVRLEAVFDKRSNLDISKRFSAMSFFFCEYIDTSLDVFQNESRLHEALDNRRETRVFTWGPAQQLIGEDVRDDFSKYLKPL